MASFKDAVGFQNQLLHPFSMIVAGPSGSGKTYFVKAIIEHLDSIISTKVDNIVYIYSCWQKLYDDLLKIRDINFIQDIPESLCDDNLLPPQQNNLLIIDDVMDMASQNKEVQNVFTKYVHHRNLSCIYLLQNIFVQGKASRTISLNSHYMVLFKNPRDKNQVMTLARQMYPGNSTFFMQAFNDATSQAYGYLFVDLKAINPDAYRLRTDILARNAVVYLPRNLKKHV